MTMIEQINLDREVLLAIHDEMQEIYTVIQPHLERLAALNNQLILLGVKNNGTTH